MPFYAQLGEVLLAAFCPHTVEVKPRASMPAYARYTLPELLKVAPAEVLGHLERAHANDGFASQYTRQTKAWVNLLPLLQTSLATTQMRADCGVLLEFPLYRLRRRIDLLLLVGTTIVVVEVKVGARKFLAQDRRQVEEYALDLRDFHSGSHGRRIIPVLWCTEAPRTPGELISSDDDVAPVHLVGCEGPGWVLRQAEATDAAEGGHIDPAAWDRAPYRPVPSVIEAATCIFAGHDVRSIAQADASNLGDAARRLLELIVDARSAGRRYLIFLTGVPGSGKTLAGLHVVHEAITTGAEREGDIVYLSGNTPLVTVLREALAQDQYHQARGAGRDATLTELRRSVRTRIQHISDFLRDHLAHEPVSPPHEHVIVFDEAQRAWDERQGREKFDRTASEPRLILDIMGTHPEWCACICLVGGGQEINSGEDGVHGWGDALRGLPSELASRWSVFGPPDIVSGGSSTGGLALGALPNSIAVTIEPELQLMVPQRSFRSPMVSDWVDHVLSGDVNGAEKLALSLGEYPLRFTRSLLVARDWLRTSTRGWRRCGLVASSGARRLRADGLGVSLDASAGPGIAHWYLNGRDDIRASYALEVSANEYTSQGLELDYVGVCWGGDMLWSPNERLWKIRRLSGSQWQVVRQEAARRFVKNSYRVLLTRAREGMVLWIPLGSDSDITREPGALTATAELLRACGAQELVED